MFIPAEEAMIDVGLLEQKLAQESDSLQRLALIDQLTSQYVYTNVLRAQDLLQEQWQLLQELQVSEFMDHYYLNLAIAQNQLYQFEEAEQTAQEAITYLKAEGSVKQLVELYTDYAGICLNLNKLEEAADNLDRAARLLKNFPDHRLSSHLSCRRAYLSLHAGLYSEAIGHFLQASEWLNLFEGPTQLRDDYFRTLIYSGLGQVYERNAEYEKSARSYLRVVKMCERLGMTNRLAWHYLNVGRIYLALGENEHAKVHLQKVIDTRDDLSLQARASAYANLGFCLYEEERFPEALELLNRAEHLHFELNPDDYYNLSIIASWRGKIESEQGNPLAALDSFEVAFRYADQLSDFKMLADICRDIAALYAEAEDYKMAYTYQCEHERFMEEFLTEVDRRQQKELEVKYQAARKEQEAELLQLKATQLQLKALRAQMNPHFIYNALNSIQNYITSKDPSTASRYLAKFAKLMRQSLEYSDQEIISLEKELEFLEDYLYINERLRFEDRMRYDIIVDDDIEEDILGVPTMIVQPYVENALEHGLRSKKDGLITVHLSLIDDDTILCVVEDNGIGRKKAVELQQLDTGRGNYRSRGTMITEKRLEILRKSAEHELMVKTIDLMDEKTGEARGTRVEIKIPIVEIQMK